MSPQNTIYIAEPIFSAKLQRFDSNASFPPIKKIGITTDDPERREKELLGTVSPAKIKIVKAWTGLDARAIESFIHRFLDNLRLDGEYFWDGNETLVDSLTEFIEEYHSDATEITLQEAADVTAASNADNKKQSERIVLEVVPRLNRLKITHNIARNGKVVRFTLGDYNKLTIGAKTNGRYTFTVFSRTRSTDQALSDFPGSQGIAAHGSEESPRRARIPMADLDDIFASLKYFVDHHP